MNVCSSAMPLLQTSLCKGSGGPCRFSLDRPGQPRLCIWPAARCTLCDGSSLPLRSVIQTLTHLYIKDLHVYDAALSTLPVERRPRARFLVRATLEVMMPVGYHSLLTVRREKTICAISALAQNTRDAPSIVAAVRAGARQLREAAPLTKKLHDVPLSLVLECALGPMTLDEELTEIKQTGYCLSRHPAFRINLEEDTEGPLAHALGCTMQIHRAALTTVWEALSAHAQAAHSIRWHGRVVAAVAARKRVAEMLHSSILPVGRALCHASFDPPEAP